MFTSLNVVRMALVDCDCSRRSATRARRRVMGTRCSGRSPKFPAAQAQPLGAGRPWERQWGWLRASLDGGQGIALGHAAIFACASHVGSGEVVFGQQLGGSGHGHIALVASGGAAAGCSGGSGGSGVQRRQR